MFDLLILISYVHGSVQNTQRRHFGVSLKHDRTDGTEKWPFWHRGRQTGRQNHDGTDKHF